MKISAPLLAVALAVGLIAITHAAADRDAPAKQAVPPALKDLWIGTLDPLPADPSNRWADSAAAADLGHRLFFDKRLSSDGRVACATCHNPRIEFQDGLPLARGVGTTDRRTMPVAGTAHSPFLFWDGRKDSQWAQALGPLESPVEHGGNRAQYAHVVAAHYRADYERLFGPLPDLRHVPKMAGPVPDPKARAAWALMSADDRESVTQVFVNVGKAIAAYERRLANGSSRFDIYIEAWQRSGVPPRGVLSEDERAGLELFVGKANCIQCHNGPLFTNNEFHNTGVPRRYGVPADRGRLTAVRSVMGDEFNCRSRWSDARPGECPELDALPPAAPTMERAFKVPSLRNVADRPPYMHAGQLPTLGHVLRHYNSAPPAPSGRSELKPLGLTFGELRQLEAFLRTLSGGVTAEPRRLAAPPERRRP
jgi:cytochrome c peroxidase